jgi:hypothetical protein
MSVGSHAVSRGKPRSQISIAEAYQDSNGVIKQLPKESSKFQPQFNEDRGDPFDDLVLARGEYVSERWGTDDKCVEAPTSNTGSLNTALAKTMLGPFQRFDGVHLLK